MLLLLMHVLTHALFGAIIVFLLKDARNLSIPKKIIISMIGGFAGILPDTFGSRTLTPWSHSIICAPLLVLPVVLFTKLLFREMIWWKIWIILSSSTIVGHIFVDFLTHEVTLLYPLSPKEFEYVLFEAGDPWVWFPLMITLIMVIFSSKRSMLSIIIVFLLIGSYMGVRSYSKSELTTKLEDYYGEQKGIVHVTPPGENLIDTKNPFDYLKWSYDLYSEQRVIRGFSPLLGDYTQNHSNVFFLEPNPVEMEPTGPIRKSGGEGDLSFNVVLEVRENDNYYLVCEEWNTHNLNVFRQELDGRWKEVKGTEMQRVLDYFNENEKK